LAYSLTRANVGSLTDLAYLRCEADPDVMADYVLALLKHEAPEEDLKKVGLLDVPADRSSSSKSSQTFWKKVGDSIS
jgi:hypothetical protein